MADPFDEMLYPLQCPRPECGYQFEVVIGRLVNVEEIPCPKCGVGVSLTAAERARDLRGWIETAGDLRKQRQQKP